MVLLVEFPLKWTYQLPQLGRDNISLAANRFADEHRYVSRMEKNREKE